MLLVDANVLMYAAGADHPNKIAATTFLGQVADGDVEGAVDAEILREILHRYRAIDRWKAGAELYDITRVIPPVVISIDSIVTDRARALLDFYPRLMARDALHAAVELELGLEGICSFDRDFDQIREIRRVEPQSPEGG